MPKATISSVIEEFRQRTSKAGKPYSAMKVEVELEDGSTATVLVFEERAIGDSLELVKKDNFWNVVSEKRTAQPQSDDVSRMLNLIHEQNKEILDILKSGQTELGKDLEDM